MGSRKDWQNEQSREEKRTPSRRARDAGSKSKSKFQFQFRDKFRFSYHGTESEFAAHELELESKSRRQYECPDKTYVFFSNRAVKKPMLTNFSFLFFPSPFPLLPWCLAVPTPSLYLSVFCRRSCDSVSSSTSPTSLPHSYLPFRSA